MALVMSTLDTEANNSDLKCGKCSEVFSKRKSLKRHYESCQFDTGSSEEGNKHKTYSCSHCDSTFRKVKTLNLHIREDHDLDPNSEPSSVNKVDDKSNEDEADKKEVGSEQEEQDDDTSYISQSFNSLNDAVEAYQNEVKSIEITPLSDNEANDDCLIEDDEEDEDDDQGGDSEGEESEGEESGVAKTNDAAMELEDSDDSEEVTAGWICKKCTFANANNATKCGACDRRKPRR